jgi:hypothetical protein
LMDTGCASDLISQKDADRCAPDARHDGQPFTFNTAGGVVRSRRRAAIPVLELEQTASLCVLPSTPSVLTIGRRCMHEGYSFVWLAGRKPYLLRPDGLAVPLDVINDIPYLVPGASSCQPVPADDVHSVPAPAPPLPPPVDLPARKPKRLRRRNSASSALWFDQEPTVSGSCATGPEAETDEPLPEPVAPLAADGDPAAEQVRRREATSLAHLLTHSPKNPFCSICARTHVRPTYHYKGAFLRQVEQWGGHRHSRSCRLPTNANDWT